RAKAPFLAACATISRRAVTHAPRPGNLAATSGVTTPSGDSAKRISPAPLSLSPLTMQRRSRSALVFVGAGCIRLFLRRRVDPARGDAGVQHQGVGLLLRQLEILEDARLAHALAALGFKP